MAERRMFAKTIMDSDAFLDMPLSTQMLYVHLGMRADDDGFVNNPKRISRMVGCGDDDLRLLILKKFIIAFESGVIVIKHWRVNNFLRNDRHTPTIYREEMSTLYVKERGEYTQNPTKSSIPAISLFPERLPSGTPDGTPDGKPDGIPDGQPDGIPVGIPSGIPVGQPDGIPDDNQTVGVWDTQVRLDKDSIDKTNKEKVKDILNTSISPSDDEIAHLDEIATSLNVNVGSVKKPAKPKKSEPEDNTPVVFKLILNDKSFYDVHQSQIDEYVGLYPAVDVPQELRNMIGWLDANPNKRKTRTGIKKFVNAWLARAQNSGFGKRITPGMQIGPNGVRIAAVRDSSLDDIF